MRTMAEIFLEIHQYLAQGLTTTPPTPDMLANLAMNIAIAEYQQQFKLPSQPVPGPAEEYIEIEQI